MPVSQHELGTRVRPRAMYFRSTTSDSGIRLAQVYYFSIATDVRSKMTLRSTIALNFFVPGNLL